jgi:hypothetical protein
LQMGLTFSLEAYIVARAVTDLYLLRLAEP